MSIRRAGALWLAFSAGALALCFPALRSPFFSDDLQFILHNPYIQTLGWDSVVAILDPGGEPAIYTWNYAPVHLLVHALQWRAFGADPLGYHLTNVLLHGAASALLVALLSRWGLPLGVALASGVLFLVHPANVETVVWAFQVKTILALVLAVATCLVFPRRPLLALVAFTLGMLTKVTAVFAVPVLAFWLALGLGPEKPGRREWGWLAALALAAALCLALEFPHFHTAQGANERYADALTHARSVVAIAARYLVMATSSYGLSIFHETPPAVSWLDPWWLAGLGVLALLAWRWVVTLRRRSLEAVFWAWAAASFALVSQVFPFLYPMGDHYLYPILPGLLGAAAVAATAAIAPRAGAPAPARRPLAVAALAGAALVGLGFTARSVERVAVWRSDLSLVRDSAEHYPDGKAAFYLKARRAATRGDAAAAAAALSALADRGFDGFLPFLQDPLWAPLHGRPDFDAALARIAGNWLRQTKPREALLQADLRARGLAHVTRGELQEAIREYEQAVARGGPLDEVVRAELEALRRRAAAGPR
jgi:hypothetical protein